MIKRMLFIAAAGLMLTATAHGKTSCQEPYAPAVPKPEETTLEELATKVKPEIESFIEESNRYLECLSVQMQKAQEEQDKERQAELLKAHNDNVDYQRSVAGEFNASLIALKKKAGLLPDDAESGEPEGGDGDKTPEENGDEG